MPQTREETIKIILSNKQKVGEIHKRQWDMAKQNFEYFDKRYSEHKQEIKALEDELAQIQQYGEPIKSESRENKESKSLEEFATILGVLGIHPIIDLTDPEENIRDVNLEELKLIENKESL